MGSILVMEHWTYSLPLLESWRDSEGCSNRMEYWVQTLPVRCGEDRADPKSKAPCFSQKNEIMNICRYKFNHPGESSSRVTAPSH